MYVILTWKGPQRATRVGITRGRVVRTMVTEEETRRLDSQPAAHRPAPRHRTQTDVNDTEQSLQKIKDSIRTIPTVKPEERKYRLCFIRVKDKPALIFLASY